MPSQSQWDMNPKPYFVTPFGAHTRLAWFTYHCKIKALPSQSVCSAWRIFWYKIQKYHLYNAPIYSSLQSLPRSLLRLLSFCLNYVYISSHYRQKLKFKNYHICATSLAWYLPVWAVCAQCNRNWNTDLALKLKPSGESHFISMWVFSKSVYQNIDHNLWSILYLFLVALISHLIICLRLTSVIFEFSHSL